MGFIYCLATEKSLMSSKPKKALDYLALAERKYQEKDYLGAVEDFRRSVALQENPDSYRALGWALFKSKQYSEAIDAFRQSLVLKEDWNALQGLGGAFFNINKFSEAIAAFRKSLELKEDWNSYQVIALALLKTNKLTQSVDCFQKSLSLKEDWNSYQGLGTALLKSNKYLEAVDAFNKSVSLKEDWNSFLGLGTSLLRTNQYSEAIHAFRKSLELKENPSSYNGLGLALLKLNQVTESIDSFRKSVVLKEGSEHSWRNKDPNLSLLIGASRYSFFHKRILFKSTDYHYYSPIYNELQDFICLCPWETECLYRYASFSKQGIIEIGRAKGGSTLIFALSNPQTKITSIDISSIHDENLKNVFEKLNCGSNVDLLVGDANEVHADVMNSGFSYDFLFIDGDHSYEACLKDLGKWYPTLSSGGLIVFHDAFSDNSEFEWGWENIGVFDAIIEFSRNNILEFIIPPSATSRFWENPNGSLCIARKPGH